MKSTTIIICTLFAIGNNGHGIIGKVGVLVETAFNILSQTILFLTRKTCRHVRPGRRQQMMNFFLQFNETIAWGSDKYINKTSNF